MTEVRLFSRSIRGICICQIFQDVGILGVAWNPRPDYCLLLWGHVLVCLGGEVGVHLVQVVLFLGVPHNNHHAGLRPKHCVLPLALFVAPLLRKFTNIQPLFSLKKPPLAPPRAPDYDKVLSYIVSFDAGQCRNFFLLCLCAVFSLFFC